jgi:hypothetical protein
MPNEATTIQKAQTHAIQLAKKHRLKNYEQLKAHQSLELVLSQLDQKMDEHSTLLERIHNWFQKNEGELTEAGLWGDEEQDIIEALQNI